MESTSKKQNTPKLWYWGEPKGGMSLEDCEKIVKEIPHFDRKTLAADMVYSFCLTARVSLWHLT